MNESTPLALFMRRAAVAAFLLVLVTATVAAAPPENAGRPDEPGSGNGAPAQAQQPAEGGPPANQGGQGDADPQGNGGASGQARSAEPRGQPQATTDTTNTSPAPHATSHPSSPQQSPQPQSPASPSAPGPDDGLAGQPGQPGAQESTPAAGKGPDPGEPHSGTADGPGNAGNAPGEAPAVATPPADAPAALPGPAPRVAHTEAGNRLDWEDAPADAAEVRLQRQVGDTWVTIATLPATAQSFVDEGAPQDAAYRLAWTSRVAAPLGPEALDAPLATLAPGLVPKGSAGAWLLGLLWGAVAAVATVRTPGAPSVPDGRVTRDHLLLSALAGLPGIDAIHLQRVQAMGLRTVGQLLAHDPEALAFWTNLPAVDFRRWHAAVAMLQWPVLPAGAAQRLALAGTASLAEVAAADPQELYDSLHARPGIGTAGPGLPDSPGQVKVWIAEAGKALAPARAPLPGATGRAGRQPV